MKEKILFILAFCWLVLLHACSGKQHYVKNKEDYLMNSVSSHLFSDSIEAFFKSKGVASFLFSDEKVKKFTILNKDGTTYAVVDITKDKITIKDHELKLSQVSNDMTLELKYDFSPKEFYPELSVIQFEFLKIEENKIEVFINKEKSILKYIEVNDFKVEDWKEHLLGCIIDFDINKNIIRESPYEESGSLHYEDSEDDLIFVITEIKGDWIKIECAEICGYSCNTEGKYDGWIMWKQQGKMIIRLLYAC